MASGKNSVLDNTFGDDIMIYWEMNIRQINFLYNLLMLIVRKYTFSYGPFAYSISKRRLKRFICLLSANLLTCELNWFKLEFATFATSENTCFHCNGAPLRDNLLELLIFYL